MNFVYFHGNHLEEAGVFPLILKLTLLPIMASVKQGIYFQGS